MMPHAGSALLDSLDRHGAAARQSARVGTLALASVVLWTGAFAHSTARLWLSETPRFVGDLRVADERVMVLSFLGLFVAFVAFLTGRAAEVDEQTTGRIGLVIGVLTTGLLGAAEAGLVADTMSLFRPGWAGLWLLLFPLLIAASTRDTLIAMASALLAHTGGRMLALSGDTVVHQELASFAAMAVVATMALLPFAVLRNVADTLDELVVRTRELGSYVLEEEIGRGGMGVVWRARHRFLRRDSAVKVIAGIDDDPAVTTRRIRQFEAEALITAQLSSPHTVALFDFGRTPEGGVYYVMELLRGLDLRRLVDTYGPLEPERAMHLLRQAADSLAEAHGLGLVHRDIKPANLQVCRVGRQHDHLKIVDFGLASFIRRPTGSLRGTPAYIAPELWSGQAASGAADVYALGLVAWWMLTGRQPMQRDDLEAMRVAHEAGLPDTTTLHTEFEIPPALQRLITSMLAVDPATRPTADDVFRALGSIESPRPWTSARAERWWTLHLPRS